MTSTGHRGLLLTIDGPAGSGKSTTAREVARRLGYRHLDSGGLYRALCYALLSEGIPPERWPGLDADALRRLPVDVAPVTDGFEIRVGGRAVGAELRTPEVTSHTSRLAKLPAVREALMDLQHGAAEVGGLVADGRDMGTVVFPNADLKVYLVADLEERARRRLRERGGDTDRADELAREAKAISERDNRDRRRAHSPMRRPDDAVELDTSRLTFEEQVEAVVRLARNRLRSGPAGDGR